MNLATAKDVAVARAASAVGFNGETLVAMVAIGISESQSDPSALRDRPDTGDYSVGVWQINYFGNLRASRVAAYGPPEKLLGDLAAQATAVWDMSGHGTDLSPWSADDRNGRRLLNTARAREAVANMAALYPNATYRPCSNHSGPMSAHLGLCLHVQVGTNDLAGEFNDPSTQASYTWDAYPDGHGDQFVDADLTAWAQGQGNDSYNSVGTQGYPETALTEACCAWIAGLYRWGHDTYGWPYVLAENPGDPGFIWHGAGGQAWGGHESCPGDIRREQRQHILDLAQGITPAPPTIPQENDMPTLAVRRAVMNPDGSGDGYLLDSEGGIHTIGNAKPTVNVSPPPPYWKDTGAAVDFGIVDWEKPSGWTMDAKGAVHGWGGYTVGSGGPYWNNAFVPPAPQV